MATTPERCDLLLTGGTILTLNDQDERFDPGAVAIRDGKILAVGPAADIAARYQAAQVIDAAGCCVMPGLINSHTHAAMTLFRGLADDLPLMDWLNHHIFPAERKLTAEWVYWGTLLACAEMILSGTTSFCDMYLFEHKAAEAAKKAGMRALVGEVLYDFPSPNYGPSEAGLRFTAELIRQWRGDPLIRIAVEPHATYTCSPDLLRKCQELAETEDVPVHIHAAESRHESQVIRKQYGVRPVRHLQRLGLLTPRLLAAHCVELNAAEIALLADSGVRIAHCPESNMKLGSGDAPVHQLLNHGATVGIGTDGCASNNDLDMFGEMDSCAKLHKVTSRNPAALPAATVIRMGTRHGAAALGLARQTGQLVPGFLADCIVVNFAQPHLTPVYNVVSHMVYAVRGGDVLHSIIHGRLVMQNRRLLTLDAAEIMARVNEFARQIRV